MPVYYLDATLPEEAATPLKLLVIYSFPPSSSPVLQGIRLLGPGEVQLSQVKQFIAVCPCAQPFVCPNNFAQNGEKHAKELFDALEAKLRDEDVRRNQKARDKFALR